MRDSDEKGWVEENGLVEYEIENSFGKAIENAIEPEEITGCLGEFLTGDCRKEIEDDVYSLLQDLYNIALAYIDKEE